jgi:hypothetical protein
MSGAPITDLELEIALATLDPPVYAASDLAVAVAEIRQVGGLPVVAEEDLRSRCAQWLERELVLDGDIVARIDAAKREGRAAVLRVAAELCAQAAKTPARAKVQRGAMSWPTSDE